MSVDPTPAGIDCRLLVCAIRAALAENRAVCEWALRLLYGDA